MKKWILLTILLINSFCFSGILIANSIIFNNIKTTPDWVTPGFCKTSDTEAPTILLDGETTITIKVGENYIEPSVEAMDDCDIVSVEKTGNVDANQVGTYQVIYRSSDNSSNQAELIQTVNVIPEYRGTIYLTFDDGPGAYTAELLDILAKYNIKATFFVTGYGDDALILREYQDGHAIGLHTSSHDYAYIYQNVDAFLNDLYLVQNRVKNITGYTSFLMRFPGGSSNTVSRKYDGGSHIMTKLVNEVAARGFTYFDWNISSGDAGQTTSSDQVFENVIYALKEGGSSVVLQHDVKDYSVAAVERIINYGLANGYRFDKLDASSFTAHHRINN